MELRIPPSGRFVGLADSALFANVIAGDPGTEQAGINVGGVVYESSLKVSDLDNSNIAQLICHRHSVNFGPVLVFSRSHSTGPSHAVVQASDVLGQIFAAGYDGADYALGGSMQFEVDGAPGINDMPTRCSWSTTPAGSQVPVRRLTLGSTGAFGIGPGIDYGEATRVMTSAGPSGAPTWGIRAQEGHGSPEGVVTASRGALYVDLDGGAGLVLYVKESASGNTGWAAK